jgi:hypothetical protein
MLFLIRNQSFMYLIKIHHIETLLIDLFQVPNLQKLMLVLNDPYFFFYSINHRLKEL